MIERIDPKLQRSEPLPVAAGGGRDPERKDARGQRRARPRDDDGSERPERGDEMLARLAAATADIRRLQRDPRSSSDATVMPDARAVAAQIARDRAAALAAQAVLGAAGVRLVLDFGADEARRAPCDRPE